MPDIRKEQLQQLVKQVSAELLSSNDVAPRTIYPAFHGDAAPMQLTISKAHIAGYRVIAEREVNALGKQQLGEMVLDFSKGTHHYGFLMGIIIASFGVGECGECASKLAEKMILSGYSNLLLMPIKFSNAHKAMEQEHVLLVANVKHMPESVGTKQNLTTFLSCLPQEAIVADPFLGICFSPNDIPKEFQDYIDAYGGKALTQTALHISGLTPQRFQDTFMKLAQQIIQKIRYSAEITAERKLSYSEDALATDESSIFMAKALAHQTGIPFKAYQNDSGGVDVVAVIDNKDQRQACMDILSKFALLDPNITNFARDSNGACLFFIAGIQRPKVDRILKSIIGPDRIGLINVDVKWQNGKVINLEMADAINRSCFNGYNYLYAGNSSQEMMLLAMVKQLRQDYARIHFIQNNLPEDHWPKNQFQEGDIVYYEDIVNFIEAAKKNPDAFKKDVVIYGKFEVSALLSSCPLRSTNEIQAWLIESGIMIPVVNAPSMIEAADDKFIFSQTLEHIPKTQLLAPGRFAAQLQEMAGNFSERCLLKPLNVQEGLGVLMLTKSELQSLAKELQAYLTAEKAPDAKKLRECLGEFRFNKLDELRHECQSTPYVLLQEYVASDPVQHENNDYDATGRVVLYLKQDPAGNQTLTVVDGYWKLPKKPENKAAFDQEACLSSVENMGAAVRGVAKLTTAQREAIERAFQAQKQSWMQVLRDGSEFYLTKVKTASSFHQAALTRHFTRHIFDLVKMGHLNQLSALLPTVPGLDALLIRALISELSLFVGLKAAGIDNPFLQKVLLHYLASPNCLIQFEKVQYLDDEHTTLIHALDLIIRLSIADDKAMQSNAVSLRSKLELASSRQAFKAYCDKASHAFRQKNYKEASQYWTQALKLLPALSWSENKVSKTYGILYNNLGACARERGQYQLASEQFSNSLAYQDSQSEEHQKIQHKQLLCDNKLKSNKDNTKAIGLYTNKEYQAALQLFQSVLAANQALFSDDKHLDVAAVHWSLSSCYLKLGDIQNAKSQALQAYEIRKVLSGDAAPGTVKAKERVDELSKQLQSMLNAGHFGPTEKPGEMPADPTQRQSCRQ